MRNAPLFVLVLLVLATSLTGLPSFAQHDAHEVLATSTEADEVWTALHDADYRSWGTFPRREPGFYEGTRPHGALLRLYVNDVAAENFLGLPHGTVIVKENWVDEETLRSIAVMRRIDGFAPDSGDWWYARYEPDGSVATENGERLVGDVPSCGGCHRAAEGGDWVYGNE